MSIITTVYIKPSCVQCNSTCDALDAFIKGKYRIVDVSQDPGAVQYLRSLGLLQVPAIVLSDKDGGHVALDDGTDKGVSCWSGFRPDQIALLKRQLVA